MVNTYTYKIGKSKYYVGKQNASKINYTQVNESEWTKKYDPVQMNNEIKKCFVCNGDDHIAKECPESWKCECCNKKFRNKKRCESHMYFCNLKNKAANSHILVSDQDQILLESRHVLKSGATQTFGICNSRHFYGNRSNVLSQPNAQQKVIQNYVSQPNAQQKVIQNYVSQKKIQNYVSPKEIQQKAIQNYVLQQEKAFQTFLSQQQVAFQNYASLQTVFQNYALHQEQFNNYEFLHNSAYKSYKLQQEDAFKNYITQKDIIFQNYMSQLVTFQKKDEEDMYEDLSRDIMTIINENNGKNDEDSYHELSRDIIMIVNENN